MLERRRMMMSAMIVAALAVLVLPGLVRTAEAGGCMPRGRYYSTTHRYAGVHHGPYRYYSGRNAYYRARYGYARPTFYRGPYRYGRPYNAPRRCATPYGLTPRRSLRYSGYATFPRRYVDASCGWCGGATCDGACGLSMRGRAVRLDEPVERVIIISHDDRQRAADPEAHAAAWRLLAEARPHEAIIEFTRLASAAPKDGRPKLGYGLSAALIKDDYNAAWALRRALSVDPACLDGFTAAPDLAPQLRALVAHYDEQTRHPSKRAEAGFMAATLLVMLQDYPQAGDRLAAVVAVGDDEPSTAALRRVVAGQLARLDETAGASPDGAPGEVSLAAVADTDEADAPGTGGEPQP